MMVKNKSIQNGTLIYKQNCKTQNWTRNIFYVRLLWWVLYILTNVWWWWQSLHTIFTITLWVKYYNHFQKGNKLIVKYAVQDHTVRFLESGSEYRLSQFPNLFSHNHYENLLPSLISLVLWGFFFCKIASIVNHLHSLDIQNAH